MAPLDIWTIAVGVEADHHRNAQDNGARTQRFIRRLRCQFGGGSKGWRCQGDGKEAGVQIFFHEISLRIKELERRRSGTANEAAIQGLGNLRRLEPI